MPEAVARQNVFDPKDCDPCLSVVMPIYNEADTVNKIILAVLDQPIVAELIAVDDGSTDQTWERLSALQKRYPRLIVHRHEVNCGKGAALRTGFAAAKSPIVLVQDADLEYDPAEYEKLVRPFLDGKADVVFGSRFRGSEAHRVLYFWHFVGNVFLTLLSNMFTNLNLTDMESGFKAFKREVIQRIRLEENRFGFEPEVTAKVARQGLAIYEVAVSYSGRTYAQGKKVNWRDGFSALRCILKYNLTH
jgi:glycosyltransferase involved in cell wall biosynthesis